MSAVFDVPRTRMFELWTRAEHLRRWFRPRDMKLEIRALDVRVDGRFDVSMIDGEGLAHGLRGEYRELLPPERIVFTYRWDGAPDLHTLVSVLLTDDGGRTRLTLHQGVFRSRDDRDRHVDAWQSTLDSLNEYVRAAPG